MKTLVSLALLLVIALAAAPALAGESAKDTQLQGWIVDAKCGAKNANAEGKDCILACNKGGSPLVLAVGDKTYKLSDQKLAKDNVGYEVVVTGKLEKDEFKVASIAKADKKG